MVVVEEVAESEALLITCRLWDEEEEEVEQEVEVVHEEVVLEEASESDRVLNIERLTINFVNLFPILTPSLCMFQRPCQPRMFPID